MHHDSFRAARVRFSPRIEGLELRAVAAGLAATADVAAPSADDVPTPLDRFAPGQTYEGEIGGFYADGSNVAPQALADAEAAAAAQIRPLNARGRVAANGRVGVVALGQSTTNQWFPYFQALAKSKRSEIKPGTFFVNGGQDGQVSSIWAYGNKTWSTLARRVGAGRLQVQVLFLDSVILQPQNYANAQAVADAYSKQLATIVGRARRMFPNLRLVYAFPFHWGGAATPDRAVSEPGAYETQFGTRQLIASQNFSRPVIARGPDVWSQTQDPNNYYDGVHFTGQGRQTMAEITYAFLKADRAANRWLFR